MGHIITKESLQATADCFLLLFSKISISPNIYPSYIFNKVFPYSSHSRTSPVTKKNTSRLGDPL